MSGCPNCGLNFSAGEAPPDQCPSCGRSLASGQGLIARYLADLRTILFSPSAFFKRMPPSGGIGNPLAFALVTHWIGSACAFLWNLLIGGALFSGFSSFFESDDFGGIERLGRSTHLDWSRFNAVRDQIYHWFAGVGPVIADPFLTLAKILFAAVFVFLGARILVTPGANGAPREIRYETAVRILCYATAPAIIAAIPLVGVPLSKLYIFILTMIGAREVYRVGAGRALTIALFPEILWWGFILMGLIVFVLLFLKLFLGFF